MPIQLLRKTALRHKLTIASVLPIGVAMLLAGGAFVTVQLITFEDALVTDMYSSAAIVGHNSAAALTFGDPISAVQTLKSLGTDSHFIGAALYDSSGQLFAQYHPPQSKRTFVPPAVGPAGHRFEIDRLELFYVIDLAGEAAGMVYIESDVERLSSRIARYGLIGLASMLVASLVAFMLTARLQRAIASPLSDLARAMNVVRADNNYSVRATKLSDDELGELIDGFNAMLDQIQSQDRALQEAREHLERRVDERTRELQQEMTERQSAQTQLEETHRQLLDVSRRAGMAEVATNVLHNVGNVLNSVNVSANVISEWAQRSKIVNLSRVAALLAEHPHDLGAFMTTDPKGKTIPVYLTKLAEHLVAERDSMLTGLEALRGRIDHIKRIVAMQQSYATVAGVTEPANAVDLLEDALRMNGTSLNRHDIQIDRDYSVVPDLHTDKHKILQILVNLVRNAKDACKASDRQDKRITLRVANGDDRIKVSVTDNGVGIAAENMTRIFGHGFTTKEGGHGFGLHGGALAARDLGGSLVAQSGGVDCGATFTLTLPLQRDGAATLP